MLYGTAFAGVLAATMAVAGCTPAGTQVASSTSASTSGAGGIALPLRTSGRWIVDANGRRVKLASVSWYGAEGPDHVVAGLDRADLDELARRIRAMGFNSVRLPWSNELFEIDPFVDVARLAANPALQGKRGMDVFDAVVAALARAGLLVVLDNHTSRADWCCSDSDGNGLWWTAAYPESSWLDDWRGIVARYAAEPAVVGCDLRNELRSAGGKAATWGGGDPATDWHAAAERGGNAVLAVNPSLLVIVEGTTYATDLGGVYALPVRLAAPDRLVYSAHDYGWYHPFLGSYADLKTALGNSWGFILRQNEAWTAPVWVGEFGACHGAPDCFAGASPGGFWFAGFRRYLAEADIDWCYWAVNGTQASGTGRTLGAEESFGILDTTWNAPASADLLNALEALQPATQGP